MGKKEKKEKVVYIDDGRTIADMSGLGRRPMSKTPTSSRFRDIWHTYWAATKMMFLPTLAICGALAVLYGVMYVIFTLAS